MMQSCYRDVRLRKRWTVIRSDVDLDSELCLDNPDSFFNEFDEGD